MSTTVQGNLKTLLGAASTGNVYVRFWLRGCNGNQPRVGGVALIPPSGGVQWYQDFAPDASGALSGSIYSNDVNISAGGQTGVTWYGVVVYQDGIAGPETPYSLADGTTFNLNSATPISTAPVVAAPTGDSTYARLDGGNSTPTTGVVLKVPSGDQTITAGNLTLTGDLKPNANATRKLGSTSLGWSDLFLAGGPWIDIRAYGGSGDGVTDNVTPLANACTAAVAANVRHIFFPTGKYVFNSKPASIPNGISLVCPYSAWSVFNGGSTLVANYTEGTATNGFLTWDGTSNSTMGFGGGLEGFDIQQSTGNTGGAAIKLTGTTTSNRASGLRFSNIRVSGDNSGGGGTWAYNLYVDGSAITTSGNQGIRDVYFSNCFFFNATQSNQSVFLNNAVHFFFNGVAVLSGGGSGTGVTITGASASSTAQSQNCYFNGLEITGNLVLDFCQLVAIAGATISGSASDTSNTASSIVNGYVGGSLTNNGGTTWFTVSNVQLHGGLSTTGNIQAVSGAVIAGASPANATSGDICGSSSSTGGTHKWGSDGNMMLRRNNGSGSGTNLAMTFDGFTTTPFQWDTANGFKQQTANSGAWIQGQASENLTLSTSGTTTDTSANLLPANAIIEAVVARVTTTITTATDWKLGDATTAGRFTAAVSSLTAGSTTVGTVQADQTGAAGPRQASAAKVRVTTTGTPGAGAIRITVFYRQYVAPTS